MTGIVLGGYAGAQLDQASSGIPVFVGIASGISVAGYFAGKQLDRRVTTIRIVP